MENQAHPFVFEDGDVRAKANYGGRIITFKLSSHALCFACPVWKKFVFPPFPLLSSLRNEEEPNSKKICAFPKEPFPDIELDFTEDNPEALLILLRIAHLRFSIIPAQLSHEVLYHIAILCDQYDCRRLVKPWIQSWLKDESNEAYRPHQEGRLWIAYYFGRKDIFHRMMKVLALRLAIGDDGKCMLIDGPFDPKCRTLDTKLYPVSLEESPLPLEITDLIVNLRKDMISRLINFTANFMERLLTGNVLSPCKELCQLAMYGLMSKHLRQHNLWPLPRTENYNYTSFQLYKSIKHALMMSSIDHKLMKKVHAGNCSFKEEWGMKLMRNLTSAIVINDANQGESDTEGNNFQRFMDHAVEDIGNFDCPNKPYEGGPDDQFIVEILSLIR